MRREANLATAHHSATNHKSYSVFDYINRVNKMDGFAFM